ncbi:hypothetical protein IG193_00630 [Infirmifilum lucidum]|uniref:Uncharacterized protein n=1 Tax=Infirmifilum lucidum TaxID=2776706 RepID=A0A7L9FJD3_9CREN|nr:hypothetical protein [Infirmifilum lucidum]QOJ79006.1 hypothetical protein IG193_00630 [Infirmifilum lucidum]
MGYEAILAPHVPCSFPSWLLEELYNGICSATDGIKVERLLVLEKP